MEITEIIKNLSEMGLIEAGACQYRPLDGGTSSRVFLLTCVEDIKYIVKINEPHVLKSEAYFLKAYNDVRFLPALLYVEPEYKYIVYTYLSGSVSYSGENKKELLKVLVDEVIKHYIPCKTPSGWGDQSDPVTTREKYLSMRVRGAEEILRDVLPKNDFQFVLGLSEKSRRNCLPAVQYLLHGDCGVHNFIFQNEQLSGVIDPTPILGDPLYDLIYAFCSSPDDLTAETIEASASYFNRNRQQLYEDVIIGLYNRIATCILHHPYDLKTYLKAWDYWKTVYFKLNEEG